MMLFRHPATLRRLAALASVLLLSLVAAGQSADAAKKNKKGKKPKSPLTMLAPLKGHTESWAVGVSEGGVVAGNSSGYNEQSGSFVDVRPVTWKGKKPKALLFPLGARSASAEGIGPAGHVVGWAYDGALSQAVMWSGKKYTPQLLGQLPDGKGSVAYGANGQGAATGYAINSDNAAQAVIFADGQVTHLGTLGGRSHSIGLAITSSGLVGGYSYNFAQNQVQDERAVLWQNGEAVELPPLPGDVASSLTSLNESGRAVGHSVSEGGDFRAVMWNNGSPVDLGVPVGAEGSFATAVNDAGDVIISSYKTYEPFVRHKILLWRNGQTTDLTPQIPVEWSSVDVVPEGFNGRRTAVGLGVFDGFFRAFSWQLP